MANREIRHQAFHPLEYWCDRPMVILVEVDGRKTIHHGLAIGPQGMTYGDLLAKLDQAYLKAVAENEEAWNYDDVFVHVRAMGIDIVAHGMWWENEA